MRNKKVRKLCDTPANIATPEYVAKKLIKWNERPGLKISQVSNKALKLFSAVANGSRFDGQVLRFELKAKKEKHKIVLVGKGITFDTGGINLKTSWLEEMKLDKCGAVTVGAVFASLKQHKNITYVAYMPLCENAIGQNAMRPSDEYETYDGTTVVVTDTDAEGRLILSDVLAYSRKKDRPDLTITVATLTGSVISALGDKTAGLFSNDDDVSNALISAAKNTKEKLWRLPISKEHLKNMRSGKNRLINWPKAFQL